LLAVTGLFHAAGANANPLARRLIEHDHLTGETARLVRDTFGTDSHFVFSGLLGLLLVVAGALRKSGWAAMAPVWLAVSTAFWLWTPRFLLHRKIGPRALLPGALLASLLRGLLPRLGRVARG
jgi:hypothetical protein